MYHLVSTALRRKFLLILSAFLGISNMFMIFNYPKRSIKTCVYNINENDQTIHGGLKRLQIEINETLQRFEEIGERGGTAFDLAAPDRAENLNGNRDDQIKNVHLPPLPDCKQAPFLLIQIHSTPSNFMERHAIRMSWGKPENRINWANADKQPTPRLWKTVFLLGKTHNPRLDELLRDEASVYEDVVFGNFTDSYRNLTKKMALGVEWAAKHCQAQYVMKADDDSFVNIFELILLLKELQRNKPLYMGAAIIDREPYREPESKFYVSEEEYPASKYPPYASGAAYVFSGKLLGKLSRALKVVRLFPNEDACFGALMQYIKVNLTNNGRFIPFTMGMATYSEYEGYSLCQFNGPLVIHHISGKLQIQTHFNNLVLKHAPTICQHVKYGIGYVDYFVTES